MEKLSSSFQQNQGSTSSTSFHQSQSNSNNNNQLPSVNSNSESSSHAMMMQEQRQYEQQQLPPPYQKQELEVLSPLITDHVAIKFKEMNQRIFSDSYKSVFECQDYVLKEINLGQIQFVTQASVATSTANASHHTQKPINATTTDAAAAASTASLSTSQSAHFTQQQQQHPSPSLEAQFPSKQSQIESMKPFIPAVAAEKTTATTYTPSSAQSSSVPVPAAALAQSQAQEVSCVSGVSAYLKNQVDIMNEKRMQDNMTMRNEFLFALALQKEENRRRQESGFDSGIVDRFIVTPIKYGESSNRVIIVSPFMNQKDAWSHLILRNSHIFDYFNFRFILSNPHNRTPANQVYFDQMKQADDAQVLQENQQQQHPVNLQKQEHLHERLKFSIFNVMKTAAQIGRAINYLHAGMNYAHNDIKPDNFFAHFGLHPKLPSTFWELGKSCDSDDLVSYYLGDFGYAKHTGFATAEDAAVFFLKKKKRYLSPDILALLAVYDSTRTTSTSQSSSMVDTNGQNIMLLEKESLEQIEKRGDVFALGVSLFQIIFQQNPFSGEGCCNEDTKYSLLQTNPAQFWNLFAKQLIIYSLITDIDSLKDLLQNMLHKDPRQRFTIGQVLNHPWLSDINNYLFNSK